MKDRSSVEIIVIVLTFVVAFVIVLMSIGLLIIAVKYPETDTGVLTSTLMSLTSAILGTLFGMLISKGDQINRRPDTKEDDE
jgi:multidrug resistance efflux pump